ncbi:MAG: SPOR domain-containing protein [Bacteroidota bacterium]
MLLQPEIGVYQITRLIEELLFANDCVIVPGFGGFVGKAVPANLNRENHTFLPPSKRIAFNGQLTHNDGLLAAALAKAYHIKFEEADARVQSFSRELQNTLLREKQFIFGRIGSFLQRDSLGAQFEPSSDINFLPEAYGLPVLKLQVLSLEKKSEPSEEGIIRMPDEISVNKKNTALRYLASAISIPAAMLVLAWPFLQPVVKQNSRNTSGFFASPVESKYKPHRSIQYPEIPDVLTKNPVATTTLPVPADITDGQAASAEQAQTAIAPYTTKEAKDISGQDGLAELIAGCFRLEENAQKLVNELRQLGFEARISGQSPGGLYRVSLGPAATRTELQQKYGDAIARGYSVWWLNR